MAALASGFAQAQALATQVGVTHETLAPVDQGHHTFECTTSIGKERAAELVLLRIATCDSHMVHVRRPSTAVLLTLAPPLALPHVQLLTHP